VTGQEDAERSISDSGFVLAPPDRLYLPMALYDSWDPDDDLSLARSLDYRTYLATLAQGQPIARSRGIGNGRALHDAAISYSLAQRVAGARSVGILGGHGEARGSDTYNAVARIAWALGQKDFTILTGGGPGAMEAAHLGARYAPFDASVLDAALARISSDPATLTFPFPHGSDLVVDGAFVPDALRALHAWMRPAMELAAETEANAGASVGIPTWLYGHEPSTPFATEHAKYFENSIREEGLLTLAIYGAIYTPGSSGTLQEIFEDANQNFYVPPGEGPSPMVFVDLDGFFTKTFPVISVLRALFGDRFDDMVMVVNSQDDAVAAIEDRAEGVSRWASTAVDRKLRAESRTTSDTA
jgi:predicted Rossmann-fold nucleotide-binding protein